VFAGAHRLGQTPEQERRRVAIQLERLVAGQALVRADLARDLPDRIDRHQ
jgi:hypothetical protein